MKGISLALVGGGARGFAHVGVLNVLMEEGIRVDEIAGTSMGAIIGAYYALHGGVEEPERFAYALDRKRTLYYLDLSLPKHGLIKGGRLRKLLTSWFGDAKIEDASIPLTIIATNLRTGKAAYFRRGPIVPALMASAAIPGLLPAMKVEDEYYIDGGAALQVPVAALRKRSTLKVAVELPFLTASRSALAEQPTMSEVLTLVYAHQRALTQPNDKKGVLYIRPETGSFRDTLSFPRSGEFVRNGEKAAEEALPRIRRLLA